jgi:tetratricopeptide (TPR) repeat protein
MLILHLSASAKNINFPVDKLCGYEIPYSAAFCGVRVGTKHYSVKNEYKYKAFISYCHRDERFAAGMHRALESYRVPRKLVGTKTDVGEVPARIKPVFRDRDDLSSASDLGNTVKQALSESENIIVICSPAAAASHWVNEEIRYFASLGRQDRIFCIIVDGDPAGVDTSTACFPAALAEIGLHEPLAADIRKWADGKHLSRLKLVSGMLGLPLDQLRRRDLQKRQKIWALAAVASVVLAAILITAVTARIAAQQRRDSGESLVMYKLNELRTMLNLADDPADLGRLKAWDQEQLGRLVMKAGSGEGALKSAAMELREQGTEYWQKGEFGRAMEMFQDSWALLAETFRRDNNDLEAFFELGQAEYYIGSIYRELGALETAEDSLAAYAEITRQLIVLQPENAEWVLEMSFALSNLGSMQMRRDANRPERALQLLQSSLEYNQIALVLDPKNTYYQSELGQSHAFLADAQRGVCDLEGALQSRSKQLALERELWSEDMENTGRMRRLAYAYSGYAVVQEEMGQNEIAIESLEKAVELMRPALLENPESKDIHLWMLDRSRDLIVLNSYVEKRDQAWTALEKLDEEWQNFLHDFENLDAGIKLYAAFQLDWAWLAQSMGATEMAAELLEDAMNKITGLLAKLPGDRYAGQLISEAVFQVWALQQELPSESVMALLPDYRGDDRNTRDCEDVSLAAKQAIMLGDKDHAIELTAYLMSKRYTKVSFMQICKAYSLCSGQ